MKRGILLLLLISSVFAHGQSIKEALFSGKLKNDPGTVIRKGEDLSTKMVDSTRKAFVADSLARVAALSADSIAKATALRTDGARPAAADNKAVVPASTDTAAAVAAEGTASATMPTTPEPVATPKNNNTLIKEYVDSVASTLKTEALASKKIKKGTYYVTVSYAIETDGKVNVTDVFVSPENAFLQSQVRSQLELTAPTLTPTLNSNGTPRKVSKKYNFTLTKD